MEEVISDYVDTSDSVGSGSSLTMSRGSADAFSVRNINTDSMPSMCSDKIPEHLESLVERSSTNLSPEETQMMTALLMEYSDVFSKCYLYIGCFMGITHKIDTQEATPVKQRMRRCPFAFQGEEEKHLKQM